MTKSGPAWLMSSKLYSSLEKAKADLDVHHVRWPAIPSAQGFYEVEE